MFDNTKKKRLERLTKDYSEAVKVIDRMSKKIAQLEAKGFTNITVKDIPVHVVEPMPDQQVWCSPKTFNDLRNIFAEGLAYYAR